MYRTLALLCLCSSIVSTYAAPLAYDESESGDLDGTQVFALDVGYNRISGTSFFEQNPKRSFQTLSLVQSPNY